MGFLCVTAASVPGLVTGPPNLQNGFSAVGGTCPMTGSLAGQADLPSSGSPSLTGITRAAVVVGTYV
jgi:hypothetical protein